MPTPPSYDWLYTALGSTLAAAGFTLLLYALFADRARARRRCPKCWYDMSGSPGLTCPECGRTARDERRLRRTRRKPRCAALAIAVLGLGWITTAIPEARISWVRAIPGWLLILITEARDPSLTIPPNAWLVSPRASAPVPILTFPPGSPIASSVPPSAPPAAPPLSEQLVLEVWRRIDEDAFYDWESQWFLGRCLRAARVRLEAQIKAPEAWPLGQPIVLSYTPAPFPGSSHLGVAVSSPALTPGSSLAWWNGSSAASLGWLPPVTSESDHLDLEVRLVVAGRGPASAYVSSPSAIRMRLTDNHTVYLTHVRLPIHFRRGREDFLDQIRGQTTDQLVARALNVRLRHAPSGDLALAWDAPAKDRRFDFAVLFRAEFLADGYVVGRALGQLWWDDDAGPGNGEIDWSAGGRDRFESALAAGTARLRLNSAPDRAAIDYENDPFDKPRAACWAGSIEVPAAVEPPSDQ